MFISLDILAGHITKKNNRSWQGNVNGNKEGHTCLRKINKDESRKKPRLNILQVDEFCGKYIVCILIQIGNKWGEQIYYSIGIPGDKFLYLSIFTQLVE